MSMPVQPLKRTSPPVTEAYFFSSSCLDCASSSVRPMMGVKVANILMDRGSRPFSAASFRMLATLGRSTAGEWDDTKMASAWEAAKEEPAAEVPAWKRKGVRCGDGSTICRLLREKYLPLWLI